jgi:hypothetical protein
LSISLAKLQRLIKQMHFSDSHTKRRNKVVAEVAIAEVAEGEAAEVEPIILEGLRSRIAKESTLTSTFLRSTIWYLKNTTNLCQMCILISIVTIIVEAVVVAVVAEVAEVVAVAEMTTSMSLALILPQ